MKSYASSETRRAKGVELRVASDLPAVEVNAAAVELLSMNLISNGIKYADLAKPERWVEVKGHGDGAAGDENLIAVEVRDNGLGVPPERRDHLFERFYRAHEDVVTGAEGTGLGLSIVRDTAKSLGGRAWAEFTDGVTVFAFSVPGAAGERSRGRAAQPSATSRCSRLLNHSIESHRVLNVVAEVPPLLLVILKSVPLHRGL